MDTSLSRVTCMSLMTYLILFNQDMVLSAHRPDGVEDSGRCVARKCSDEMIVVSEGEATQWSVHHIMACRPAHLRDYTSLCEARCQ